VALLLAALDPAACAAARLQTGSSSPEAMREMLEHLDAALARDASWSEAAAARAKAAEAALVARARELAAA
jgi:hypothetical protein